MTWRARWDGGRGNRKRGGHQADAGEPCTAPACGHSQEGSQEVFMGEGGDSEAVEGARVVWEKVGEGLQWRPSWVGIAFLGASSG